MPEHTNADTRSLAWEEVKTEHLICDKWIDFRSTDYRFPDGTVVGPFYTYSRRDYCVIVARDDEGKYICVKQFRQGIRQITTEFPAGGVDNGDGADELLRSGYFQGKCRAYGPDSPGHGKETEHAGPAESTLDAAKRELREETGYSSEQWTHLLSIPSNATISDNYAHIFLAENCRKTDGQDLDDLEFLNVVLHSGEEIEAMIQRGEFQQSVHVMAWLLACRT